MIRANRHRWAAPLLDAYNRSLLKKSFARMRVQGLSALSRAPRPLILAANHSCWWDGCVDLFLSRSLLRWPTYLMMGETELAKHAIFSSIGIFSVPDRPGVTPAASLRYIARELRDRQGVLWIYPQGVMLPPRAPLVLFDGALLLSHLTRAPVVPIAQRYEFLRDDHPEVIVKVGEPLMGLERRGDGRERLAAAMGALRQSVDEDLAERKLEAYEIVMEGALSRNEKLARLRRG